MSALATDEEEVLHDIVECQAGSINGTVGPSGSGGSLQLLSFWLLSGMSVL